jgi:orotate phosphoribosyltransferase
VDDLVTTGATAQRATELLRYRGITITAWTALARTPSNHRISRLTDTDLSQEEKSQNFPSLSNHPRSGPWGRASLDGPASSW